jgi:N-acetylglucosamine-6-sulfatase
LYEWYTPSAAAATTWTVVELSNVNGLDYEAPTVHEASASMATAALCQAACSSNSSCVSYTWTPGPNPGEKSCGYTHNCWWRSDAVWKPKRTPRCAAISGTRARVPPAPTPQPPLPAPKSPLGYAPNVVFILTDDQDRKLGAKGYDEMGSLAAMPATQKLLIDEGVFMDHFYVNTPICCPSRTEFFSGRYYHNVGPPAMEGNCMHVDTSFAARNDTGLFGLMTRAGYNTGVFGKVTNDQSHILSEAISHNSMSYVDSPLNYNNYMGTTYWRYWSSNRTQHTETLDKKNPEFGTLYQTSQIGNRTLRWLKDDALPKAKAEGAARQPFFLYIGPHAPHFPATPAPWYQWDHPFQTELTAPRTPNYNYSDPSKAQHVRQNPAFTDTVKCWEDQHFRDRWMTLLSVDEVIEEVVGTLTAAGVMDKTYIFYSSDHGYKQGQWRIGTSKQHPYETDVLVHLLVRGPGIKAGSHLPFPSGNVDVLPTILELATGWSKADVLYDGQSLAKLLITEGSAFPSGAVPAFSGKSASDWRDSFTNEYKSVGTYWNDHSGVAAPSNYSAVCGGGEPRGPSPGTKSCTEETGVGNGSCYFVDSTHSNNWRSLRVLNGTHDLTYIEYDPAFTFVGPASGYQHIELYDNAADEYQMKSLAGEWSAAALLDLHDKLVAWFECKDVTCA